MSFWPFPTTILEQMRSGRARGPGIDAGGGSGELRDRLAAEGIDLLTMDLRPPADVVGDALHMPMGDSRIGLVLAANLVRHLDDGGRARFLAECSRVLGTGGRLVVVEDVPAGRDAAERNYRRCLDALARWLPDRGTVTELDALMPLVPASFGGAVADVLVDNELEVRDPVAPLRWLQARGHGGAELAALGEDVERHGMRYGQFRCVVFLRGERPS